MTTKLTKEKKEEIARDIEAIDARIAAAREAIKADKYDDAKDQLGKAIELKGVLVTHFPGIDVNGEGFFLPFFAIYETFGDIDTLLRQAEGFVTVLMNPGGVLKPGVTIHGANPSLADLIDRLKIFLSELEINLLDKPWFEGDTAPDILEELADKLRDIIAALQSFLDGNPIDPSVFKGVEALKKKFLDEVSDSISLWDAYVLLSRIDELLLSVLRWVIEWKPLRGRSLIVVRRWLELAEAHKHKLKGLVDGTPLHQDGGAAPGGAKPDRTTPPPKPQYPPGFEDLPPFPPDDHASVPNVTVPLAGIINRDEVLRTLALKLQNVDQSSLSIADLAGIANLSAFTERIEGQAKTVQRSCTVTKVDDAAPPAGWECKCYENSGITSHSFKGPGFQNWVPGGDGGMKNGEARFTIVDSATGQIYFVVPDCT